MAYNDVLCFLSSEVQQVFAFLVWRQKQIHLLAAKRGQGQIGALSEELYQSEWQRNFQWVEQRQLKGQNVICVPVEVHVHIVLVFLSHRLKIDPSTGLFDPWPNNEKLLALTFVDCLLFLLDTRIGSWLELDHKRQVLKIQPCWLFWLCQCFAAC